MFQPRAHEEPGYAADGKRHNSNEQISSEPGKDDNLKICDAIEFAVGKDPAGAQTDRQPKRARLYASIGQNQTDEKKRGETRCDQHRVGEGREGVDD